VTAAPILAARPPDTLIPIKLSIGDKDVGTRKGDSKAASGGVA